MGVPTLHRVIDAKGTKRIIMFSSLYPRITDQMHVPI
jgi:hypothetical protein